MGIGVSRDRFEVGIEAEDTQLQSEVRAIHRFSEFKIRISNNIPTPASVTVYFDDKCLGSWRMKQYSNLVLDRSGGRKLKLLEPGAHIIRAEFHYKEESKDEFEEVLVHLIATE